MVRPALTHAEFIAKASNIHKNKYDYSNISFKTSHDKIKLICPMHGEFTQMVFTHANGAGCKKCALDATGLSKRLSLDTFIEKANKVHNSFYSYVKTKFITTSKPVIITCPIHGDFKQRPNTHLQKKVNSVHSGCPLCARTRQAYKKSIKEIDFITHANLVHNNKYDYSEANYKNITSHIMIKCTTHGLFRQTPSQHLLGNGCPICSMQQTGMNARHTRQEFIDISNSKHNNKYDYSNAIYVKNNIYVTITCTQHGDFIQTPANHMQGRGCPRCTHMISKWEQEVQNLILARYPDSIFNVKRMIKGIELDIYIPCINTAIECNGDYWHMNPSIYTANTYNKILKMTARERWIKEAHKHKLIKDSGIHLIVIWENEWMKCIKINKAVSNSNATDMFLSSILN